MAQQVTASGSTTTTVYAGALAEYTLTGSTSWQKYYSFAGRLVAGDNGHWHELLQDHLGTAEVQLNASGAGESGSLRLLYGSTRYGSSAFMGDLGYTGQRKDSAPNLVYFNARSYDQDTGVFTSADTTLAGGLNRYGYVGGNPETLSDPSGHIEALDYLGVETDQSGQLVAAAMEAAGVDSAREMAQAPPSPPISMCGG